MKKALLLVTIVLGLVCSTAASAQMIGIDWLPTGSGARALGMGGAFTSIADDATAAWWNPAGLSQLERPEVSIVGQHRSVEGGYINSTAPSPSNDYSGTKDTYSVNFASYVLPFGGSSQGARKALSFSYGTFMDFNSDIKTADGFYKTYDGTFDNASISFATEITPNLSVGVGVNYIFGSFDEHSTSWAVNYFIQHLEVSGYNIAAGLLWRGEKWNLGLMARSKSRLRLTSTGEEYDGSQTNTWVDDTWILRYPHILGIGAAYKPTENFTAALDLQYINFSDFNVDANAVFVDIYQPRLGLEYLIITKNQNIIPVRLGAYYNPLGTRDYVSGSKVGGFGYTAGTGIVFPDFQLDLAYVQATTDEYAVSPDDTIKETTVKRILLSAIYRF